jgi:hypothetical protein
MPNFAASLLVLFAVATRTDTADGSDAGGVPDTASETHGGGDTSALASKDCWTTVVSGLARPVMDGLSGGRFASHPRQLLGDACPDPLDEDAWGRVHAVTCAYLADRLGSRRARSLEAGWELIELSVRRTWRESARDLLFYNRVGAWVAAENPGLWNMAREDVLAKVEEMFDRPAVRAYERALTLVCPP